jgi:hypothetical protein
LDEGSTAQLPETMTNNPRRHILKKRKFHECDGAQNMMPAGLKSLQSTLSISINNSKVQD